MYILWICLLIIFAKPSAVLQNPTTQGTFKSFACFVGFCLSRGRSVQLALQCSVTPCCEDPDLQTPFQEPLRQRHRRFQGDALPSASPACPTTTKRSIFDGKVRILHTHTYMASLRIKTKPQWHSVKHQSSGMEWIYAKTSCLHPYRASLLRFMLNPFWKVSVTLSQCSKLNLMYQGHELCFLFSECK